MTSWRPSYRLVAATATVLACVAFVPDPGFSQQVGPGNGSLVIVGGAMRDTVIIDRFLRLAGGLDAPIVMIPTGGRQWRFADSGHRQALGRQLIR